MNYQKKALFQYVSPSMIKINGLYTRSPMNGDIFKAIDSDGNEVPWISQE
jgi:hypothetical protein